MENDDDSSTSHSGVANSSGDGAKAKRPRASKSLLVSFKPGSSRDVHRGTSTDSSLYSATGTSAQSSLANRQQQQRVAAPSLPYSSSTSSLSTLQHQPSSPSLRDRSPSFSSGSQRQHTLRRSRSNSNITSCIPAAPRQEDWIWKRPPASTASSSTLAAAAKGGDAAARNQLLLASLIDPPPEDEEEMVFLPHEKPSSRPGGASARPSPGSSLEAIAKDRHYAKGEKVPFDEDREHEFKQLHNVDKPVKRIADYCGKYINAFLNTNGGVCYFGIDDDGVVYGVHLSRSDRDAIRLHVDGIVESFWPAVDTRTCAIVFVPVADPCPTDTFVMELHVSKGTAPVYLMSKNKPTAYMRRSGSIYQMSMEMILQRMNFTMGSSGSVFQPLQNTLTYKLGNVPRNFVGRQTELEEILDQVEGSEDHVKVVSLYGQGGVGKTTLSRRIAAAMASAYPDGQFCIQLNGSTPNPIKTYDAMLYAIRAFHPSITMPSSPTEVEGYYLSCFNQKRSVLLLDDAGSKEQVLSLLPKSTCLVIVTSRRSLGLDVEIGAVCVKKLGKLSLPEAIAMVQQMTRGKVTEEQAAQLAQLCGYLPLAVQVVSATLAKQSNLRPEAMIQRLTENKGEILRLEGNTLELCIKASFELLSPRLQHLFLPLSIFPGSFDEEAAAHVLDVDAQTAQEALSEFLTNSLLEHNPVTWRYHLHFTVRVFSTVLAQKIEQEQSPTAKSDMGSSGEVLAGLGDEMVVNFALWKERFVLHYHDLIKRFQTLYKRGGDYILSGLELFDQNKHNFEEAMRLSITELKRYSLFCSFARAGQDIFRARFNQSKLMELYRDFLTAAKPELIVTHRRGRGRGAAGPRGRSGQAVLSKAANAEDDDQEQDYQDNDDADDVSASPNATGGKTSRRASLSTAASESESELVEDDDLVFVLNELGQAFAAQGQYHTAEAYYHHALRISEKHSASSGAADDATATAFGAAGQSADDICSATSDAVETTSAETAGESAPIPIPRANSDFASPSSSSAAASASPPLGRAAGSWLAPALASPISLATEHETKRWRRNLATTLHNLGKLYGEQCSYTPAVEHLQRALDLRQLMCGRDVSEGRKPRGQETEGKKRMRRGMEDREMVGESMLALGACYTQLGKYDEAERQFKAVLSLYRPTTSSPLINAITRLSPPSELISGSSLASTPPSLASVMAAGLPTNLDQEIEIDEEMERQRLRDELKLSKLGSTDSHGLQVAACLDHLGALLTIRGKYMEAFSLHSTSLGMKQKLLGSSHLEVARTRHYLAKVLGLAGRYKEAIQEYEVSLRIREDCLGPSHPLVANSLRHIAFLHFYTGEYAQAEKMYAKALKMLKDVFDRPHLEVAIVLNDLGLIYNHQSRYAKSQPLLRHSLAIRKKLLGKRHPYIAVVFNNLGNMYRKQRNYESAEKYLLKALAIRENCFGKEHPEVARSLHNIAALRMAQKRYPEAQALFQRSLEVRSKVLGHFHPELSAVHNAIGNLHECQKDLTGAIAHYNVALQLNRKAFGDYHPSISTNYYKLGNCYRLMKRYAEAEPMLQASRDVCFRCFGEEEDHTGGAGPTGQPSRVSRDHRITPGHERILQSDDTLQKFYKEWAEYIVLQSREKRRLEDKAAAAATDASQTSPPAAVDDEAAAAAEAEADRQRLKEARRRRRERRRQMKREGTWVEGQELDDEAEWYYAAQDAEEAKEDEKFKRCIEVLKRMGREEDLAEVMRIEQRLHKLREHRRQRLEKERTERDAQRKASGAGGSAGDAKAKYSESESESDTSEGEAEATAKKKAEEVNSKATAETADKHAGKVKLKKLTKNQRKQLMALKLAAKAGGTGGGKGEAEPTSEHAQHKKRKWTDDEQQPTDRAEYRAGPHQPHQQQQQAVVVITVRHLVALVLALVTLPVSLLALYLYFISSSA